MRQPLSSVMQNCSCSLQRVRRRPADTAPCKLTQRASLVICFAYLNLGGANRKSKREYSSLLDLRAPAAENQMLTRGLQVVCPLKFDESVCTSHWQGGRCI